MRNITQTFFQRIIERGTIRSMPEERAKLRSFLLGCLRQLLCDRSRHDCAEKRGGGHAILSFDEMEAEERYAHEP